MALSEVLPRESEYMSAALFQPITIGNVSIRNRIWLPALCQYSVPQLDGVPTDWQLVHLGAVAAGGAGLLFTEATAVTPDGRISDHDTGIWNDEQGSAWSPIVSFVQSQGAKIGVQLAHAGRKASTWADWNTTRTGSQPIADGGWETVAPSALAFPGLAAPRALAADEIPGIVTAFADAAERAERAGFDVVEVHAAHGYLIHQFLSPLSNQRSDEWGGSLENRARLLREIVRAIRARVSLPIFVRFSATDWIDGGWDVPQTSQVTEWLMDDGADFFDISSGALLPNARIPIGPNYQVPLAAEIHESTEAPVVAVGLITAAQQAEEIVSSGKAQAVMLGRAMMRDPHWVLRAAHELGETIDYWPPQYRHAALAQGRAW